MRLILLSDTAIRLAPPLAGPMTIESPSPEVHFSPFHMVAAGLAACSVSVMHVWAEQAGLSIDDLTFDVAWEFAEQPHRVGRYDVRFSWPSLPPKRLDAARRVSEMCAIHATLRHSPILTTEATVDPIDATERARA
jgi:uncharacterized OsmC-like protein